MGASRKSGNGVSSFCFSKEALKFLVGLEKNNNKEWFDTRRDIYEEHLLSPMKTFVSLLGRELESKLSGLNYTPKVGGSLFRINRDIRFSKDKRPYKTHTAAFLWVGPSAKMECPGVYIHLDAKNLLIGAGLHMFSKDGLDAYRNYVDKNGAVLQKAINKADKAGFELGGEKLQRVPTMYDKGHKYGELLKMKGMHVGKKFPASAATKPGLVSMLKKEYTPALDLVKILERALF